MNHCPRSSGMPSSTTCFSTDAGSPTALHEQPLQPDDYIFRAVSHRGTAYLTNVDDFDPDGAISGKSAAHSAHGVAQGRRGRLETVRVHDLRHTWALRMVADRANDSAVVQRRAHHSAWRRRRATSAA